MVTGRFKLTACARPELDDAEGDRVSRRSGSVRWVRSDEGAMGSVFCRFAAGGPCNCKPDEFKHVHAECKFRFHWHVPLALAL